MQPKECCFLRKENRCTRTKTFEARDQIRVLYSDETSNISDSAFSVQGARQRANRMCHPCFTSDISTGFNILSIQQCLHNNEKMY